MAVAICGFDKRRGPPDFRQTENHNGEAVWDLLSSLAIVNLRYWLVKVSSIDQKPQRMGGLSTEKKKRCCESAAKSAKEKRSK